MKLPKRLKSEPIIDAIFEVRFAATKADVVSILPGYLYAQLGADRVERLPAAEIPEVIQATDPTLRAMALQKVYWDRFYVLVGRESLGVGCQLPYPGWAKFKPAIERAFGVASQLNLIESVHRYSAKYVDLLPTNGPGEALAKLDFEIKIGGHKLSSEPYMLRAELVRDKFTHVLQNIGAVQVTTANQAVDGQGRPQVGSVVDIDSICEVSPALRFGEFLEKFPDLSEEIHTANKVLFFECLKPETVESLGPEYE